MAVLVVGTRNVKKRQEILEILADLGIEVRDMTSYHDAPEVEVDGKTFEENARKEGEYAANNAKLLAELARRPGVSREAYYVCTAVVADPGGEVRATAEGRCHGVIIDEARGEGGFGYDPLFLIPEYHQTFGEF